MEPVTHALTSLVLARATQNRLPRFGTAILIVSGVAADLDYLSYFGGAEAFLRFHRAVLHSLLGSGLMVSAVAAVFYFMGRRPPARGSGSSLPFIAAFVCASLGAAWHLLLDFASGEAVQLFWPFRVDSSAWNFTTNIDPWILMLLAAGLLLPGLFRLVSDEIGERKTANGGRREAVITLFLLLAYVGTRGFLHHSAVDLLLSREYHGRAPVFAGAFPRSLSPLDWRCVVFTDSTIEEVNVSLAAASNFDPDRGITHFKPDESPALDRGETTPVAKRFLNYARFPLASVYPLENGSRFELHDLQFSSGDTNLANIFVRVDFDANTHIKSAEYRFTASRQR
ncbi:MAG: metal-dependent hydrolase [Candidatus Acidiferrales bacterium]